LRRPHKAFFRESAERTEEQLGFVSYNRVLSNQRVQYHGTPRPTSRIACKCHLLTLNARVTWRFQEKRLGAGLGDFLIQFLFFVREMLLIFEEECKIPLEPFEMCLYDEYFSFGT